MGFVNEDIENRDRHTIDKERKIILSRDGYNLDYYLEKFKLTVNGTIVKFEARSSKQRDENSNPQEPYNVDVIWTIYQIIIPKKFQSKHKEVKNLIVEALEAYGDNHKKENAKTVTVNFNL